MLYLPALIFSYQTIERGMVLKLDQVTIFKLDQITIQSYKRTFVQKLLLPVKLTGPLKIDQHSW